MHLAQNHAVTLVLYIFRKVRLYTIYSNIIVITFDKFKVFYIHL